MRQSSIPFGPSVAGLAKPRLVASFSFGRTSALMTKLLLEHLSNQYEILVVVANTGQERDEALEFGHLCDTHFGFNAVWLEAVTNPEDGVGTGHRVVSYETATRISPEGGPFEDMIRKYGIPGPGRAHCTRELKANAIRSYLRSIGWDDYTIALGIRPDEERRADEAQIRLANQGHRVQFIYPLIDYWYHDKQDVNDWWEEQPFNLQLQEHEGNCAWCWKKSFPKHARLLNERPDLYAFPATMEARYPRVGAEFARYPDQPDRVFFRLHTTTVRLKEVAELYMSEGDAKREAKREKLLARLRSDENGGCTESCEPYPMLDLEAA